MIGDGEERFLLPNSLTPSPDHFTMSSPTLIATHDVIIDIGAIPILVRTDSADFANMLADRYGEFVVAGAPQAVIELEIRLIDSGLSKPDAATGNQDLGFGVRDLEPGLQTPISDDYDEELSVRRESGRWVMERGDFRAEWDPETHRGWVRQTANPYSIDGVLRILHSLILARAGGFLVHAASAVRNGRAFVFAGVSGAGKTTISRLAPPDVALLTDEITYIRGEGESPEPGLRSREAEFRSQETEVEGVPSEVRGDGAVEPQIGDSKFKIQNPKPEITNSRSQTPSSECLIPFPESRIPNPESPAPSHQSLAPVFQAYGTPFAGELARIGQKVRAPLETLFLLKQGPENRIEPVSEGQAVRELMRHVLFFAHDEALVGMIFQTVCDFVRFVPVRRLVFTRDARVWELIG